MQIDTCDPIIQTDGPSLLVVVLARIASGTAHEDWTLLSFFFFILYMNCPFWAKLVSYENLVQMGNSQACRASWSVEVPSSYRNSLHLNRRSQSAGSWLPKLKPGHHVGSTSTDFISTDWLWVWLSQRGTNYVRLAVFGSSSALPDRSPSVFLGNAIDVMRLPNPPFSVYPDLVYHACVWLLFSAGGPVGWISGGRFCLPFSSMGFR